MSPHHSSYLNLKHFTNDVYTIRHNWLYQEFRNGCMKIRVCFRKGACPAPPTWVFCRSPTQQQTENAGRLAPGRVPRVRLTRENSSLAMRACYCVTRSASDGHLAFPYARIISKGEACHIKFLRPLWRRENVGLVSFSKACFIILRSLREIDRFLTQRTRWLWILT